MGHADGFIKIVGDAENGEMPGVNLLGEHSTQLIGEVVTTMTMVSVVENLAEAIKPHPTLSEALMEASSGDFVYLDPPYPPLNNTSNFTRYTKDRFSLDDHKRLAQIFYDLDNQGCLIMMSNADIPLIRKLFRRYNIFSLPVTRYITCKSKKHQVRELIITNYEPA